MAWSSEPRLEAAAGLVMLVGRPGLEKKKDVETMVLSLAGDQVPTVRFQISQRLKAIIHRDEGLAWQLCDFVIEHETNISVLGAAVRQGIGPLGWIDPPRGTAMVSRVFDRVRRVPDEHDANKACLVALLKLDLWKESVDAARLLDEVVANVDAEPEVLQGFAGTLRSVLANDDRKVPRVAAERAQARAVILLSHVARGAIDSFATLRVELHRLYAANSLPQDIEAIQEQARTVAHLIDSLNNELYFASGTFDAKDTTSSPQSSVVAPREAAAESERRSRFLAATRPLFEILADAGLPSATHHYLETLEFLGPADPHGVILLIARAVRATAESGYQTDSMAEDVVVRIAERYLGEYRSLLECDADARHALLDILDVFATAGWPRIRRLLFRLDEIYR